MEQFDSEQKTGQIFLTAWDSPVEREFKMRPERRLDQIIFPFFGYEG